MLGVFITVLLAAGLCFAAYRMRCRRIAAESQGVIATGTVVSVRKVSGHAFGEYSYWYEAEIQYVDEDGESHVIRNDPHSSSWKPRQSASVNVLYPPGQPADGRILEEEEAGEQLVLLGAGFFLLMGVLSLFMD